MSKKAELIGSHFPTIYLTVISLLQGIALSQLVPNIITYLEMADNPWLDIKLIPLVLMLLVIFIVWHHYAIGIFFLRWFPNIIDTTIPFLVSIGQFILISFITIKTSVADINVESWTIGYAILLVSGSIGYFGAAFRLEPELFTNIMSFDNAVKHCRLANRYYNWSGLFILFQGLFALLIIWLDREQLLLLSLIFMVLFLVLSEYLLLRMIKPHFIKALDDFEAREK